MAVKIGIDVGGTFTDFILVREGAQPLLHKVLSTPHDPSIAVVDGLAEIAGMMNPPQSPETFVASIDTIVHGTTVTTNATLTGNGARTALLTTEGVRDALETRFGPAESARLAWRPLNSAMIGEETAASLFRLIETLEDSDDVQNVYANFEVGDEVLARLSA